MQCQVNPSKNSAETSTFTNWKWQQRNMLTNVEGLAAAFPSISKERLQKIQLALKDLKMGITPYYLSLMSDENGIENDPLFKQVIPYPRENIDYAYDGSTENWEEEKDMVTPIAQRKYDNRVIVRLSNVCHSYCQFCYEALRTLDKNSDKGQFQKQYWQGTLDFIEKEPAIQEIILSGGEPLMLSNKMLENVLKDIRQRRADIVIRIHTRSLTFNPYRVDEELVELLRRYEVKYVGLHITHPNELSDVLLEKVKLLQKSSILFANIPLLKGINDDEELFKDFCVKLYSIGVLPHYLYHFMPFSPGSNIFKTSIEKGVSIIKSMKRNISNLAVPEFVLPHSSGKHTVPIFYEENSTEGQNVEQERKYTYINWKRDKVEYYL